MVDLSSPMNSMVIGALISILVSGVFFSYERGVENRDRERDWCRNVLNTTYQISKKLNGEGRKVSGTVVTVPGTASIWDPVGERFVEPAESRSRPHDRVQWDYAFISSLTPLFLRLKALVAGSPNPPDLEFLEEIDHRTDTWMTLFSQAPYWGNDLLSMRTPDKTVKQVVSECDELHEMAQTRLQIVNSRGMLQLLWYR